MNPHLNETKVWLLRSQPDAPEADEVEGVYSSEALAREAVERWPNRGRWPDGSACHKIEEWTVDDRYR